MEDKLVVSKLNETFMRLDCDHSMLYELSDEFQFLIPGAKFNPKVKAKVWDGKIRLVNIYAQKTYIGLYNQIKDFCARRNYKFVGYELFNPDITPQFTAQFIKTLNLPPEISFRDYQYYAVHKALKNKRALILSPTGSGKSAQIYSIVRYLVENDKKVLVVVPTIGLTTQMKNDFIDYSKNKDKFEDQIHIIYSGKEKQTDKPVTISTWQSIYKMGKEWYQQWDAVIVDECFSPETKVLTKTGWKSIEHVAKGEIIKNINKKGELKDDVVLNVHKNLTNSLSEKMYKLTFEDGSIVECTGNHKFMLTNGEWKRADKLTFEDNVLCPNIEEKIHK